MEVAGLLGRRRDPQDERRVLITLTKKGRALGARAVHVPETMANGIKPEGLDELRENIRTLVSVLAQHNVKQLPVPDLVGDNGSKSAVLAA
jgi:MarR family transcriptional regulator, organic hydroperoxide resistance regulator